MNLSAIRSVVLLLCLAAGALAIDGYVVITKESSKYGTGDVVIRDMSSGSELKLADVSAISACFSPDANEICYNTGGGLYAVGSTGGSARQILSTGFGGKDYVVWCDNGYIYWSDDRNICRTRADGSGSRQTVWSVPSDLSGDGIRYFSMTQNAKWAGISPRIDGDGRAVFLNAENRSGDRFATGCQVSVSNDGRLITYAIDGHRTWYVKRVDGYSSVGSQVERYDQSSSITGHRFSHFSNTWVLYVTEGSHQGYMRNIETDQEVSTGSGRPWDYYPGSLSQSGVRAAITAPASDTTVEGSVTLTVRASAESLSGSITKVEFYLDDTRQGEDASAPYEQQITVDTRGAHTVKVTAYDTEGYEASDQVTVTVARQEPYSGTPTAVPGRFEAEDFDNGGEGLSWHDMTAGNRDNQYRQDVDVDINVCDEGGYYVTSTDVGEWVEYTVSVAEAGTYDLLMRVRSANADGAFHVTVDGANVTGPVAEGITAGQTWETLVREGIQLSAGSHVLRVQIDSRGYVLNWFELASSSGQVRVSRALPARHTGPSLLHAGAHLVLESGYPLHGSWRLVDLTGKMIADGECRGTRTIIGERGALADGAWLLHLHGGDRVQAIRAARAR